MMDIPNKASGVQAFNVQRGLCPKKGCDVVFQPKCERKKYHVSFIYVYLGTWLRKESDRSMETGQVPLYVGLSINRTIMPA